MPKVTANPQLFKSISINIDIEIPTGTSLPATPGAEINGRAKWHIGSRCGKMTPSKNNTLKITALKIMPLKIAPSKIAPRRG